MNFAKFLRTPFLTEHLRWLLLLLHFLCSLLCYLFMQENVQTNIKGKTLRRSFKIAALKNFAITVKETPVLECLFNKVAFSLKKRLQHRFFLKKFLRTAFFLEHLAVRYAFLKFYVMIEFLDIFRYKIDIFHISCTIALISSMVYAYPYLFSHKNF